MNKKRRDSEDPSRNYLVTASLIFSLLLAGIFVVVGLYVYIFSSELSHSQETWGQFGDYFGGILNPAVGVFSIVLLLYTIWLQKDDLRLQRNELALQRNELEKSTMAQREQGESLKLQSFESTFFSMLQLCQKTLEDIKVTIGESEKREVKGKQSFRHLFDRLKDAYRLTYEVPANRSLSELEVCQLSYRSFINAQDAHLRIYLATISEIVRYIALERPAIVNDSRHWKILSSQLSQHELSILYYEILYSGGPSLIETVRNAPLFDLVSKSDLIRPESHYNFFNSEM